MSLDLNDRRRELERLGFRVVSEDAGALVATRKKWHWECFVTQLTIVALVRRVASVTAADMDADEQWLHDNAARLDPSTLPRGFQKGRAFLSVYLADRVDTTAVERARRKPALKFATFYLPAVVDATGSSAWYDATPIFGAVYYPIFQFLLRRLLSPTGAPPKEPPSKVGILMTAGCLIAPALLFCVLTACLFAGAMR